MHATALPLSVGATAPFPPMPLLWPRTSPRWSRRRAHRQAQLPPAVVPPAETVRERVDDAIRRLAHGVAPTIAHARTIGFYRSGGYAWSRALVDRPGEDFRGHVARAFFELRASVDRLTAQARSLRFYGRKVEA